MYSEGAVLLTHRAGMNNTFLPGGHIEFGEPARAALAREIKEELGSTVEVKKFLGAVEHSWVDENGLNHEVNLVFLIKSGNLSRDTIPVSRESHLEFAWQPVSDLASCKLEPSPLVELLVHWLSREPDSDWGTTIE